MLEGRMSALDIADLISRRELSAEEVFQHYTTRIEALNPSLNAVVTMRETKGRAEARYVDRRVSAGETLPLAGVPFTVKDNIWVKDEPVSQGSLLYRDFVAPRDAVAVERLRRAGAVCIGITNCSEFACKGVTENLIHGVTRNPHGMNLTSGGSSGGAASAVAANLSPLALCTDAGGSTRRPAAMVGIVGMKPSQGLVPLGEGFDEPVFGNGVIGQMACSAAEIEAMIHVISGYDPQDPQGVPVPLERTAPSKTAAFRVAYSEQLGLDLAIDTDVASAMRRAITQLRDRGVTVEAADPPWPAGISEHTFMPLQHAGLAALYGDEFSKRPDLFDPDIGQQILTGMDVTGRDIAKLLLVRERMSRALSGFLEEFDFLLCPTVPVTAWPVGQLGPSVIGGQVVGPRGHAAYTPLFNHAGVPACTVPCGQVGGLPVGLQIVSRRFSDMRLLRFAADVEQIFSPAVVQM